LHLNEVVIVAASRRQEINHAVVVGAESAPWSYQG